MAKKATKAQIEQRVRMVYELLLSDTPYRDVLRYAATRWGVKPRTVDNYIKSANEQISEEAARMRQDAMEKHLAQRALLRNKALKDGDKRLAFEILRDESKLLALYPADRLEIRDWRDTLPDTLDANEVQRQFKALLTTAAQKVQTDRDSDD